MAAHRRRWKMASCRFSNTVWIQPQTSVSLTACRRLIRCPCVCWQNGTLKIVDRKKHIFKLAQGEYIAPEKIENVYMRSDAVAQVFVHGDSLQVGGGHAAVLWPVILPLAKSSAQSIKCYFYIPISQNKHFSLGALQWLHSINTLERHLNMEKPQEEQHRRDPFHNSWNICRLYGFKDMITQTDWQKR